MNRKHLAIGGIAAILAALALYFLVLRGDDAGQAAGPGAAGGPTREGATPRVGRDAGADAPPTASADDVRARLDPPDPDGPIRLEGQVLGPDDQPLGGAEVWLTSRPPRKAVSEADGSFEFDKLLPRTYALTARADDLVGGPVSYQLTGKAEPVVIRLREGARLTVKVSEEATGKPVAGATVALQEAGDRSLTTDGDGAASFRGLSPGWSAVTVRATGFAPASTFTTIGVAGSTQEIAVALRKGAAVSGRVVDEAGAGVADAMVTIRDAGATFAQDLDSVVSGPDGAFELAVVPAGSYTLGARDAAHAPGVSEIISLDGVSPRTGVTVVMKEGGVVRGRVVTKDRQPAPFAAVQLAAKGVADYGATGLSEGPRQTTADAQGHFELRALPRIALRARAESDDAASQIVDVDLTQAGVVEGLELVLDVSGAIAGVVVDGNGDPVPEAQVSALPDFFGKDGDTSQLGDIMLAGFAATVTDGGGAFRLRGLPDGAYRLWASRTAAQQQMFVTEGTIARTGDTAVKIVLPAPGSIEGRIALDDGSTPKLAMIAVGVMPASPVRDGTFEIGELMPGRYDVHVRGPDFAELVKRDVEVTAGKVTDLGTLTVKEGRRVTGRVVDAGGAPVEGAKVMVGEILFSQGSGGGGSGDQTIGDMMGVRSARTGADGRFTIVGATEKGGSVIAEHDRGRSDTVPVSAGKDHVTDVTLTLRGFGSVHGKVTMEGQPVGNAQIMASSMTSTGHIVVVTSSGDGEFAIDKLPAGKHKLSASRMENFQMTTAAREVTVIEGQRAEVEIDIPVGKVTLTVEVKGRPDSKPDAAQVFLFRGAIAARNAKEITDRFLAGDAAGMGFWLGGETAFPTFAKLVAGGYTVCTLPINGSLADMQFQRRLQENMEHLLVYCEAVTITEAPDQQRHVAVVPAMKPLPAE